MELVRRRRTKQINAELYRLKQEEKDVKKRLQELDILENKTVEKISGKYYPDYIGELCELGYNALLYVDSR